MTLIELMILTFLLFAILMGIAYGIGLGSRHGAVMSVVGAFVGAIAGGAAGLAIVFAAASPFILYDMIRGALEPAVMVCRCAENEGKASVPEHLVAQTPMQEKAIRESHTIGEWDELKGLWDDAGAIPGDSQVAEERVQLASAIAAPAGKTPRLHFKYTKEWPAGIRFALSSGLPPRMCLAWATACVEAILPVFESEFHQDTRPRQIVGAAILFLKTGDREALELCRALGKQFWTPTEAGCRVARRSLKERAFRLQSKGQRAASAAFDLAHAVVRFDEPSRLWAVYEKGSMADGYDSMQSRCQYSQPAFFAGEIAVGCAQASQDSQEEKLWQERLLAQMILGWGRWEEDRAEWRTRVLEEWIPRVERDVTRAKFKIPELVGMIRRELVPWEEG